MRGRLERQELVLKGHLKEFGIRPEGKGEASLKKAMMRLYFKKLTPV